MLIFAAQCASPHMLYLLLKGGILSVDTSMGDRWFIAIEDAKMGKYPQMKGLGSLFGKS